jgi:hypothetical protein
VTRFECGELCDLGDDALCSGACGDECLCNGLAPEPACGPGEHWVDTCTPGPYVIEDFQILIEIDNDGDCTGDVTHSLSGAALFQSTGAIDVSTNILGMGGLDGHLDVIDVEVIAGGATDGVVVIRLGTSKTSVAGASLGGIVENNGAVAFALMRLDLIPEFDFGDGPLRMTLPLTMITDVLQELPFDIRIERTGLCAALLDESNVQVPERITRIEFGINYIPPVCGDGIVNAAAEECESDDDCGGSVCLEDCTCEGGPFCDFDPCVAGPAPSAVCRDIDECVMTIEAIDPFCVNIQWDGLCASRAGEFCGDRCSSN